MTLKADIIDQKLIPPHGTDMLCKNLVETTYDRLSEDNIRIFKDRLLDMTGCIFGGAVVEEGQILVRPSEKAGRRARGSSIRINRQAAGYQRRYT